MADIKTDYSYEAAREANAEIGKTEEGRKLLSGQEPGKTVLDKYEEAERLKAENVRDELTGLFNYGYLVKDLDDKIKNSSQKPALLWVDMDNLKNINDTYGHETGNELIKGVARVLANKIRLNQNGIAARYGGDEFVLLIPGYKDLDSLKHRGEEIRKAVAESKFRAGKINIQQSVSVGVGLWNGIETPKQFLERVDKAMYEAKNKGRNLVVEAL